MRSGQRQHNRTKRKNTFFLTTPAVSVARHDVSTGLPQPFSSKQQKKKMPTFLNLLVLFLELSGRCGASSRRSCGNVTFGVDVGVLCIKRSVSRVTKKKKKKKKKKETINFKPRFDISFSQIFSGHSHQEKYKTKTKDRKSDSFIVYTGEKWGDKITRGRY